ncbi:AMP_1a_G0000010.mRNA.1.CDS.1 [Saccharomyces cerevisiae]|nr:AMP_1a_G0000010.mRNA.1.CDS.1 [Saccharomyces cerevisiae]CAI6465448.1 AMP_1a_G0000010.mRNA.1.CDS.1 [Saccharomyces cerevisiae]
MHTRSAALRITHQSATWTAPVGMLIGLFYNKTFRQKLEISLEQISRCMVIYHIGLIWQTLKFSLQITRGFFTYVHADGPAGSQKSWIAMMFQIR